MILLVDLLSCKYEETRAPSSGCILQNWKVPILYFGVAFYIKSMRGNAINISLKLWSAPSIVGRSTWAIFFPELYSGDSHLSAPHHHELSNESYGFFWPFWGITGLPLHPDTLSDRQTVDWSVTSQNFPWSYWLSTHQKKILVMKKTTVFNYQHFSPFLKCIKAVPFFTV